MTTADASARAAKLAELPLEPAGTRPGFVTGTSSSLRDIWLYHELLGLLIRREIKVRYKDSLLGFLWSLLRPLATLVVYYVAIGKFLGAERSIPDFAIFVFTGLTLWQLFSEIISGGTGSIVINSGLIKKVYLPREVFPLSVVGSALFNFIVQSAVLLAATVVVGQVPTGSRLLFIPLAVAVVIVYATAFALMLGAVNVYLRDVQYLVEIALMVLFWTAPIVYSWELVAGVLNSERLEELYLSSPLTIAILAFQRAFWVAGTQEPVPPDLGQRLLVMLVVGVAFLWLGQRVFARLEGNFAQEL